MEVNGRQTPSCDDRLYHMAEGYEGEVVYEMCAINYLLSKKNAYFIIQLCLPKINSIALMYDEQASVYYFYLK